MIVGKKIIVTTFINFLRRIRRNTISKDTFYDFSYIDLYNVNGKVDEANYSYQCYQLNIIVWAYPFI